MAVETGVLDSYKSILQVFRHHINGYRNTVGVGGYQLRSLIAFNVVDEG